MQLQDPALPSSSGTGYQIKCRFWRFAETHGLQVGDSGHDVVGASRVREQPKGPGTILSTCSLLLKPRGLQGGPGALRAQP